MVVVIIISVLAVVAVPSATQQFRDRRTRELAEKVTLAYREARLRALGRGSAVLVRFDKRVVESGTLEIREGVEGATRVAARGVAAGCAPLPSAGCTTNTWNIAQDDNRRISLLDPSIRGEYANMELAVDSIVDDRDYVDVCFSPMGGAFIRYADNLPFARMVEVPTVRVWRKNTDGDRVGLLRSVLVLPNGVSRIGL